MRVFKVISLALVMLLFACGIGTVTMTAYAAEGDELTITPETSLDSTYFVGNTQLFNVLLSIVNAERVKEAMDNGEPVPVAVGYFAAGYFDGKTSLNLNNGDETNIIGSNKINDTSNKKILSLDGLENLFLGALEELKIDNNNLSEIRDIQLRGAPNLKKLTLKGNRIERVERFEYNQNINYLDLSGNKLQAADLSNMAKSDGVYYDADKAYVNLDYNNIETASYILLPNTLDVIVDLSLIFNNLMTANLADFGGHNASLFVQGYKPTAEPQAGDDMRLVDEGADEISAKLFYRSDSSLFDSTNPVVAESSEEGLLRFVPGKVVLRLYRNGTEIDTGVFVARDIDIRPSKPQLTVVDLNGKALDVSGSYGSGVKITATGGEGVTIWAKEKSTDEYVVGNEVTLATTGNYQVSFVAVFDGLTSDETLLNTNLFNAAAFMWMLIAVVILIVLIIVTIIMVRWYRAGGIVAPLSEKERGKIEKPRR